MANETALEVPPPGVGVTTVIELLPAADRSEAGTAPVICVGLTNFVVKSAPFQFTTVPATNPVPVAVSVNPASPTAALVGETEPRVGVGFVFPPGPLHALKTTAMHNNNTHSRNVRFIECPRIPKALAACIGAVPVATHT
jgi:hypothetical protein